MISNSSNQQSPSDATEERTADDEPAVPSTTSPTDTSGTVQNISDLVTDADFPKNAVGQQVNIGGFVGTVVEYVRNSVKVRSPEGSTRSYNIYALRRIYGPAIREEIPPEPEPEADEPTPPAAEKRNIIAEPNFDVPLRDIQDIIKDPDFPMCAFGQYLDLHGYSGVVVEIAGNSLKVRSREGATRSYNADGLRKLYARQPGPGP